MLNLSNKVAIVTGAAGNLGAAVADALGAASARTVLVDRSQDRLAQAYRDDANRHLLGGIDLTSQAGAAEMVAAALARFGRVDALVNTVGGFRGGKAVHEEDLATWDLMMTVNLRASLLACRAVIPTLRAQGGGAIVNIAASAALAAPPGLAAYSASKAALLRLTESLANENKPHGIRVNAVLPGTMDTPQNRQAMPHADASAWVRPEDVAAVIAFLVSDAACAVTGAALPVTGRA